MALTISSSMQDFSQYTKNINFVWFIQMLKLKKTEYFIVRIYNVLLYLIRL